MVDLWDLLQLACPPTMLALLGLAVRYPAHRRRFSLGTAATLLISCAAWLIEEAGIGAPAGVSLSHRTALMGCGAALIAGMMFNIKVFADRANSRA